MFSRPVERKAKIIFSFTAIVKFFIFVHLYYISLIPIHAIYTDT